MTEAPQVEDRMQALLETAVGKWVVANPYDLVELVHEYNSTGNPFLALAEAKWHAAAKGELSDLCDDSLEKVALLWVNAHPASLHEEYSTTGNEFLWAAEGAFFDFLREARQRLQPKVQISEATTRKAPIPNALRWEIWERDNFTCQHCGTRRDLAVDHIVPESKGGSLDPANLQTLCRSCNSRKGASETAN